jgi:nicotinamidase/pyrazinamidase
MNNIPLADTALIVVDVQNDFINGTLPVGGGDTVAYKIGTYVKDNASLYDLIVVTQDWHLDPGNHFAGPEGPDYKDTWPVHCVAGTVGAELSPHLDEGFEGNFLLAVDATFQKGQREAAYSGFEGTGEYGETLDELLRARGVRHIDVVGIASSHCVKATALDGLDLGYEVRVLADLTVGVTQEGEVEAFEAIEASGGYVVEREI